VVRVGGKGDRKGNKVVIRGLEGGCSEISRRAASSKDEVKHVACHVSWRDWERVRSKRQGGERESWKEINLRQALRG
jgi:hypothetical protein